MATFHALAIKRLPGKVGLIGKPETPPAEILLEQPALSVMTDLTRIPAASVSPDESVDQAHTRMLERRVRMLFVIDTFETLFGLVTSTDILGEKPMQIVRDRGIHHDEIRVQDIMTPVSAVEALGLEQVKQARVGEIVETMREQGRHHMLVVRRTESDALQVCGVFSAADLSRLLGFEIVPLTVARTFAEIEKTLAHE
ncbi:MAG TPA: CBS domain-containing protein [Azoarcus sp.]|nr:CBS domain-containing protein [Azoarcus sp.]